VFKAFDDCVQITCSKNIEDSYSFNIWGSVGNTTSNAIRIFLVPQSTNVELTFNGTDVLQDQGSTVTIVTSYTNKQGATT
jgi:type V secretory pathway adhesin AidA